MTLLSFVLVFLNWGFAIFFASHSDWEGFGASALSAVILMLFVIYDNQKGK